MTPASWTVAVLHPDLRDAHALVEVNFMKDAFTIERRLPTRLSESQAELIFEDIEDVRSMGPGPCTGCLLTLEANMISAVQRLAA